MTGDEFHSEEAAALTAHHVAQDHANWHVAIELRKYAGAPEAGESIDEFMARTAPIAKPIRRKGNILVNAGIQLMLDKLIGGAGTVFDNTNAAIGVGDSSTAAAASQTDLQASTNKVRVGMDATFPSRSGQTMTWRSSFGPSQANFAWQEWAIFNATSGGTMLNRKVESLGTKSSGTWVLAVSVTIS